MGLIGDRKAKKQKEKEIEKLKLAQKASPLKKGGGVVGRYPAGYYTTPGPQSASWHPAQPRHQQNVNPRYQTWVAPRKQQPHLGQLVCISSYVATFVEEAMKILFVTFLGDALINFGLCRIVTRFTILFFSTT